MSWSLRIAKVAGIGIYMHVTFLLLPLWIGVSEFSLRQRWGDAASGVAFILVLFVIVVLHELGHALTARRFGIRTRDITLLPIGGVARLERMPRQPRQELLIALAGPAVNVGLAVLLFGVIAGGLELAELTNVSMVGGNFLAKLMWVNVALAAFNLVPAFPMDGGRVLRALLATRLSYARATKIAARVGQTLAVIFGIGGLIEMYPFWVLLAMFVFMGATQEASLEQIKSALSGVAVSQVMATEFQTLRPREPLARAAELLLAGWQNDFPVMEDGRLEGVLTRAGLLDGLARRGDGAPVEEVMQRQFARMQPDETAENALAHLENSNSQMMAVMDDGHLCGIVTRQSIRQFLMVKAALGHAPEAQEWARRLAA